MSSSERLRNEKYFFYKYAKENTKTKNLKKAVKTEVEKKTTHDYIFFVGTISVGSFGTVQ